MKNIVKVLYVNSQLNMRYNNVVLFHLKKKPFDGASHCHIVSML